MIVGGGLVLSEKGRLLFFFVCGQAGVALNFLYIETDDGLKVLQGLNGTLARRW